MYILNVMLVLTVNLIEPGIIWEMASGMLVEDFCTEMRRQAHCGWHFPWLGSLTVLMEKEMT